MHTQVYSRHVQFAIQSFIKYDLGPMSVYSDFTLVCKTALCVLITGLFCTIFKTCALTITNTSILLTSITSVVTNDNQDLSASTTVALQRLCFEDILIN